MPTDTGRPLRVALLSTSSLEAKGSMRAYAQTVVQAMSRYAPNIACELLELDPRPAASRLGQRWQTLAMPWRAWRARRQSVDVWHVLDGSRAYSAAWLPSENLVVTVHDIIPWLQDAGRFPGVPPLGRAARSLWLANRRVMRRASVLAAASARTAQDVAEEFAVDPARCRVVTLPLRPVVAEVLASGASAPIRPRGCVMHVGNAAFYKNREGVLRVFAQCHTESASALVMAGPPPVPELLTLAQSLGIASRVRWLVDPSDAELVDAYRSASVLLFPSRYEGFGWPVLEAMALGLPVVSSRAGSLPEVAGAAAVADPDDIAGLASAVDALLASPERAAAAAAYGRERAEHFGERVFAERMRAVYLAAAASNQDHGRP